MFCLLLLAFVGGQVAAAKSRPRADRQTAEAERVAAKHDHSLMVDKVAMPREVGPQPESVPATPPSNGSWSISLLGLAVLMVLGYCMRRTAQPMRRAQLAAA